jgi:hypothetical protein
MTDNFGSARVVNTKEKIISSRISRFFNQGNFAVVAMALVLLTAIRSGIRIAYNLDIYRADSLAFPKIDAYYKSSLIMPITTKLFGLDSSSKWITFYGLVTAFTILFVSFLVFRLNATHNTRLLLALVLFSQLQVIMFTELGKFDLFLILGSIILIFGKSLPTQLIGALAITMGNFEQSIVLLGALALFSISTDNQLSFKRYAFIGATAVAFQFFALNAAYNSWSAVGGDSRFNWLTGNWFRFFKANLASLPTLIYSGYGACWLLIVFYISKGSTTKNKLIHFSCLILIPLVLTLTTFDGTRIWVIISAPLLLVVIKSFATLDSSFSSKFFWTVPTVVIAGLLMPALNVEVEGKVKIPYLHLFNILSS